MTKSLLLKGLAGVATVAGAVGGGGLFWFKDDIFGDNKAADLKKEENKFSHKELIDKVGLNCGLSDEEKEITGDTSKECSIKENGTISIKVESQTEEGVTFNSTSGSAKLKVRRSKGEESYNRELKFVVDSGDITLTKKEGGTNPATTIQKLEQFETYEIKEEGDKFYLFRKTDSKVGIKNALGLGSFSLPDAEGEANRTFNDAGQIKQIRFEGHSEGISITSGTITLKVSSTVDTTTFPYGYRFNFTFPADITINTKSLKGKIPYEFKIKKGTGNSLTLEQAWTDNNVFTKKAGLDCSSSNKECSVSSTDSQKLNVKVGNQKKTDISSVTTGKIKMETEQEGYNQGLKFTIAEGDATFTDGSGDGITKLEELETYEITEDGGKYYLTKKTSPDDLIKTSLGIKGVCELPTTDSPVECNLDEGKFKAIKFEGKDTDKPSGTATLTISKANSTDFPFGYKFTFRTETDTEIKASDTTIKGKIPKDFKIKKNTSSGTGSSVTLTLEKAWDDSKYSLAAKVGLTCTSSDGTDTCCTKTDGGSVKLNVKKGTDIKTDIDSVTTTASGKIKVEKDKEGYNQGLKFTITGGDVTLSGGSGGTFTTLEELETYEITEDKGKYYLTRKTGASEAIESQLGLKEAECSLSDSSSTCSLTTDKLKKINFSDKEANGASMASGNATLTITKTDNKTDFPLGYKFTLQSEQEITIKNDTNKVKANIPTDFKIKKGENGASLTLEKAWDMTSLGKKVGLTCNNDTNNTCTIENGSSNKLKVWQKDKYDSDVKQTTLSKTASGNGCSTSGKIKVEKDQTGYNQGFKFKIEDGNIKLDGSTGGDESSKIHRLGEFETYEIKEESDKQWYLVRKDRADGFIKKQLQLVEAGCSDSEKFPHGTTGNTTCRDINLEKLKKINFEGKNGHSWPTASVDLELEIKEDSSLPGGFKFIFSNNGNDNVCLPTGNGGKFNLQKGDSSKVEYKIKRTGKGDSVTLTLEKKDNGGGSCSS